MGQITESSRLGADTVKWLQEFAGVRAHKTTDPDATFDLSEIVGAAIEISRQWWEINTEELGARIRLQQSLQPGCQVRGSDETAFETAVNLIKHAADSLTQGGVISISTYVENEAGVLLVENDGPGLSEEERARLFEPDWTTGQKNDSPLAKSLSRLSRRNVEVSVESGSAGTLVLLFGLRLPIL